VPGKILSWCNPRHFNIVVLGKLNVVYMDRRARFSSCVRFILHFLKPVLDCSTSRLVCSFCEAMAGSLSVASTALLSTKVVVDSSEAGRFAVYNRYNNGPRTLP
jgi:hypothetical protein